MEVSIMSQLNLNNIMLQLDYRNPFNAEEQAFYESICQGLDRQLPTTVQWLKSDEAAQFYKERSEFLDWLWENEIDLTNQLDSVINYNSSASTDEFMSRFYHMGSSLGAAQLKRSLAYTPADENTLNFIRLNNYNHIKVLNNDIKGEIQKVIFEDIARGNSYQTTINKLREVPLKDRPLTSWVIHKNPRRETGKIPNNGEPYKRTISGDVRARMIARTERARARNFGSLQQFADYGVEEYDVITAGDSKVCDFCISIEEGNPYRLSDSRGYPPFHPRCRCGVAPHIGDAPLSNTPVDFPVSVSEYVDITMNPNRL
jgi:SPP1 gp7 family putative phage head morphogenesis protein